MAKIDGVSDIQTDIPGRSCRFKVKPDVDYQAKLDEFAKSNDKLAGFEIQ